MSSSAWRTLSYALVAGLLVACPQAEAPAQVQVQVQVQAQANVEVQAEPLANDLADPRIQVSITYCIP